MDWTGVAWALRELMAWSRDGSTGILAIKFRGGQVNAIGRRDSLSRRDMTASLTDEAGEQLAREAKKFLEGKAGIR